MSIFVRGWINWPWRPFQSENGVAVLRMALHHIRPFFTGRPSASACRYTPLTYKRRKGIQDQEKHCILTMSSKPLAIIAGVGAGLGASIARRFAAEYTTVLMARNIDHLKPIEKEIQDNGGDAFSVSCDVSQPESVKNAFGKIKQAFPNSACAAAVFNATGPFVMKSILDVKVDEFDAGYGVTMYIPNCFESVELIVKTGKVPFSSLSKSCLFC